jgi:hypothetical protein
MSVGAIASRYLPEIKTKEPKEKREVAMDLNIFQSKIPTADIPKLLKHLLKKHHQQTPGFIYLYLTDKGIKKIGRTKGKVGVTKRLYQKKCDRHLKLIQKWWCEMHELTESMIHLQLKINKQCFVCFYVFAAFLCDFYVF